MSFSLKALMGDRSLKDCALSFTYCNFEDERRASGPLPFSVMLSRWRPWEKAQDSKNPSVWVIANRPAWNKYYYDYCDLLAVDESHRLWHKRLKPCADTGWSSIFESGEGPDFSTPFSMHARSTLPGNLFLIVVNKGVLFANWPDASGTWGHWAKLDAYIYPDLIFGLPDTTAPPIPVAATTGKVFTAPSTLSIDGIELYVTGADGHFYCHCDWRPLDSGPWRKIDVTGLSLLQGADYEVAGDLIFALDTGRAPWSATIDHSIQHLKPNWEKLSFPDLAVSRFTVSCEAGACRVFVTSIQGDVQVANYTPGQSPEWTSLSFRTSPDRGTEGAPATAGGWTACPRALTAKSIPLPGSRPAGAVGRLCTRTSRDSRSLRKAILQWCRG